MRISFSGTANTGKSTLLNKFRNRWPMYVTPARTYRDVINESKLPHSSNGNDETQLMVLDFMMKQLDAYENESHIVYDRCPWDNLAYTLYGNSAGNNSDEVTAATISFVKDSMKNLDIIFWLPYPDKIKIEDDGMRDANKKYIRDVDTIFQDLYQQYADRLEDDIFYPKEDCPAIIPIEEEFLTIDDRLFYISQFIDDRGNLIIDERSILDPQNVELMDDMMKQQMEQMEKDKEVIKIMNNPDSKFVL